MNNLLWIDILKGIGILFVVAGHIYIGDISKYIYLFHMPLFFFIGGYLFTIKQNQIKYLKNKIRHLIYPYISFLILLYFIPLILKVLIGDITLSLFLKDILKGLVGGRFLLGITGIFWFITVFFFTQQILNYLLVKLPIKTIETIIFTFIILSYITSYFSWFWLPLNLNVTLASIPLFYIGYIIKTRDIHFNKILILLIFIASYVSLYLGYGNTYDMKYSEYGIPLITLLSCIYILIYISKFFSKTTYIYIPIKEFGLASMIIMYLHQPIQISLNRLHIFNGNQEFRFIAAVALSYLAYVLFNKYPITRNYLLGKKPITQDKQMQKEKK